MSAQTVNQKKKPRKTYKKKAYGKDARVKKLIKQEIRAAEAKDIEVKSYDNNFNYTTIDYSGTSAVWGIADGIRNYTMDTDVIGSKIKPVGLRINFNFVYSDTYNLVRLILVQFRGPTTTPSVAGILHSVGNIRAPMSMYNRDYNDTYKVLYDKIFDIGSVDSLQHPGSIVIPGSKLRRMALRFASAGSTLGAYEDGAIYLFAVSDSAVSAHPTLSATWRLYFTDA